MRNANARIYLVATAAILAVVLTAASPYASAVGVVSSVSGPIVQRGTLTINGSGFGAAPTVILFDDFEGGTDGNVIMTGSGSAAIGQWNATSGTNYYDDTYSVSGSLAFQADHVSSYANYAECLLPSGTMDFFGCWWLYIPADDNIPGEGTHDGTNWKTVWVQGTGTSDDDETLPTRLASGWVMAGNNSPYTKYMSLDFHKGEWKRVWVWIKGGYSSDGACQYWELDSTNGVIQRVDDSNISTMYSGGERERIRMNGYGRTTPNCHPGFDDFYVATGANARARVEIGNNSVYEDCTELAIQAPTSWSSSSISAMCNVGGLGGGDWYLFVVDAAGNASTGYQVATGLPTYALTVNSGTGDGSYVADTTVSITANAAPSGQIFDTWTGDIGGCADVNATNTSYTMPPSSAEITATYTDATFFTLTVNSGTGDGDYIEGMVVNIDADAPASGKQFDAWVGNTTGIADINVAGTTITMPASDATVTATYREPIAPTIQLIVNWGDSEGNNVYGFSDWTNVYLGPYQSYSSAGPDGIVGSTTDNFTVNGVNGSAESFSGGDQIVVTWYNNTGSQVTFRPKVSFDDQDYWDGGSSSGTWHDMTQLTLDDAETGTSGYTLTSGTAGSYSRVHVCRALNNTSQMLCDKIELATPSVVFTLTINSGTGDGQYTESEVATVSADAPDSGYIFDQWVGDTAGIADLSAAATTLTMPASDAEITATYVRVYALTVNNGTGDGQYLADSVVDISAAAAPSGFTFKKWTGDTFAIADVDAAATTLTMPPADTIITATYAEILKGDLDGSGYVGQDDLDIILDNWGLDVPPADPSADPSGDNWVGQPDLDIVLDDWGKQI